MLRSQTTYNQSGSSNHALLITKSAFVIKKTNAFCLSQSAFSNFASHVIIAETDLT